MLWKPTWTATWTGRNLTSSSSAGESQYWTDRRQRNMIWRRHDRYVLRCASLHFLADCSAWTAKAKLKREKSAVKFASCRRKLSVSLFKLSVPHQVFSQATTWNLGGLWFELSTQVFEKGVKHKSTHTTVDSKKGMMHPFHVEWNLQNRNADKWTKPIASNPIQGYPVLNRKPKHTWASMDQKEMLW